MLVDSTKDTEEPLLKCKGAFETMLNLISNLYTVKIIKTNFKTNTIVSCRKCKYPDGNYSGLQ